MKKILFVLAHMDDEIYHAGTISKLREQGHKVYLFTVCGQGRKDDEQYEKRFKAYDKVVKLLFDGYKSLNLYDLTLTHEDEKLIKHNLGNFIYSYDIDTVYTHFKHDLHDEHKLVSKCVRTECRPATSKVCELYECYTPGSTEYGGNFNIDEWNEFININKYLTLKVDIMKLYNNELKGANTVDSTLDCNSYFARLYNQSYTEIFKCIYRKG
jgi:LmbE family N-acetylglucosaminyl deacetylase